MSEEEPKRVLIADDVRFDEKLLAQGSPFIGFPIPKEPSGLKKLWARLRVAFHAWKEHFTRHAPSRKRRVYVTTSGDIVIYSWRTLSSIEAHGALLAAQNAERALRAGELRAWS